MKERASQGGSSRRPPPTPHNCSPMPPFPSLCLLPTPNPKCEPLLLRLPLASPPQIGVALLLAGVLSGCLSPENRSSRPGAISSRQVTAPGHETSQSFRAFFSQMCQQCPQGSPPHDSGEQMEVCTVHTAESSRTSGSCCPCY